MFMIAAGCHLIIHAAFFHNFPGRSVYEASFIWSLIRNRLGKLKERGKSDS